MYGGVGKAKNKYKPSYLAPGFTLIEVVISIVIMAVLFILFALMFSRGKAFIKGQGYRRVAINLAQERLEQINSMLFTTLENNWLVTDSVTITESPPETFSGVPMDGTGGTPDYSDYTRQTFIGYIKDDPLTSAVDILEDCHIDTPYFDACDFLRVRVTVSSTKSAAEAGRVDEVSLETILSRWQ